MNIDFMRKVDYWCGIPLATLATGWVKIADRFNRRRPLLAGQRRPFAAKATANAAAAKRVLFIELSEMGSAILVDPALKRAADGRECFFVIFKKNAASLGIFGTIRPENVFLIRDDSFWTLTGDTLRFFAWCRRRGIEAVIDLELFSRFTALLSAFSGAAVRIGFFNPRSEGLYRGSILTHPVSYNPHIHIAKNFIALVEPLCDPERAPGDPLVRREIGDDEIAFARVEPSLEARARVREILRRRLPGLNAASRLFLVNVNAGDFLPQRKWPKSHFAEFTRLLLASEPGVTVLLTGSPKERPSVEEVARAVSDPRCVNIAGDLEFAALPALYAISEAILTNDSGPAHFASAVGLRTFVLFGPETPALYGPLRNAVSIYAGLACSPCVYATNHRNTPCQDNQCLKQISPRFVHAQATAPRPAVSDARMGAIVATSPDAWGAIASSSSSSSTPLPEPAASR